jgi:hypothetical protein
MFGRLGATRVLQQSVRPSASVIGLQYASFTPAGAEYLGEGPSAASTLSFGVAPSPMVSSSLHA